MSKLYDFRDYDKNLNLKISTELWLVIVYLMRPYIAIISSIRMGRGGGGTKGVDGLKRMLYPDDFSLAIGIVATIPAILFIIAQMRRKPGAGSFIRMVWRNSSLLLSLAAMLNIAIVFVPAITGIVSRVAVAGWVQIAISVAILVYLNTSKRVKDTFADFPKADDAKS